MLINYTRAYMLSVVGFHGFVGRKRAQISTAEKLAWLVGEWAVGRVDRGVHRVQVVLNAVVVFDQRPNPFLQEILIVAHVADLFPTIHQLAEFWPRPTAPHAAEDGNNMLVMVAHRVEALARGQPFVYCRRFAGIEAAIQVTADKRFDSWIAGRLKAPEEPLTRTKSGGSEPDLKACLVKLLVAGRGHADAAVNSTVPAGVVESRQLDVGERTIDKTALLAPDGERNEFHSGRVRMRFSPFILKGENPYLAAS